MPEKSIVLVRLNVGQAEKGQHPSHCTPPFSLKYLEALLRQRAAMVRLIDAYARHLTLTEVVDLAQTWQPDIIVVLVNVVNFTASRAFIEEMKARQDVFIIAMGQILPAHIPDNIDVFLPGEGEQEADRIIERLLSGQTRAAEEMEQYRHFREKESSPILVQNLDELPVVPYTPQELKTYQFIYPIRLSRRLTWGHILSSRGCPYPCLFCSPVTRESFGDTLRVRHAVSVVDEMEQLKGQGVNMISFDDDNFTTSRTHVEGICHEIQRRGLKIHWLIHGRINNVDFELLKLLRESGCLHIRFGVESGASRVIELTHKAVSGQEWIKRSKEVFADTRQLNIATTALFVIGCPTETQGDMEQTFQLAKDLRPDIVQLHFFMPYPGSRIYEQLKSTLKDEEVLSMYHYTVPRMTLSAVSTRQLEDMRVKIYRRIFFSPRFLWEHIYRYAPFYCHNTDIFFRLLKGVFSLKS